MFKNSSPNVEVQHRQRTMTRLFLFCLSISLVVISLCAFLSTQTKITRVTSPSEGVYEQLFGLHSDRLQCSCSHLAIRYSDIIEIVFTFHQLCSSEMISSGWYDRLNQFNKSIVTDIEQFEFTLGGNYFQILSMFCQLAKNTIDDAYRIFSARTFINNYLLSEELFSRQVNALIDEFMQSTLNQFNEIFSLSRTTIQINQLASRTFSNFQITLDENNQVYMSENFLGASSYQNTFLTPCSCISQGNRCSVYTYVYNSSDSDKLIYIDGLKMKCLPTESVLASTLQCWYDEHCFSIVHGCQKCFARGVRLWFRIATIMNFIPDESPWKMGSRDMISHS